MVLKCKKGFKKVGTSCVTNKSFKKFGKFADEVSIMKLALIGAITSVGGWAIFKGIVEITGMENLNPFIMIGIGLGIIVLSYKFGFKKLK